MMSHWHVDYAYPCGKKIRFVRDHTASCWRCNFLSTSDFLEDYTIASTAIYDPQQLGQKFADAFHDGYCNCRRRKTQFGSATAVAASGSHPAFGEIDWRNMVGCPDTTPEIPPAQKSNVAPRVHPCQTNYLVEAEDVSQFVNGYGHERPGVGTIVGPGEIDGLSDGYLKCGDRIIYIKNKAIPVPDNPNLVIVRSDDAVGYYDK